MFCTGTEKEYKKFFSLSPISIMCQLFLTPFFQIVFDCFSCICIKKFYTLLYRDGGGGWVEVVGGREAWHSAVYGVAKSWT